MIQTVPVAQATIEEAVLPECVQEALGPLVGAAKEGSLALSVEVGLDFHDGRDLTTSEDEMSRRRERPPTHACVRIRSSADGRSAPTA